MVCTTDELLGWKDFPKGLKVLLLDKNNGSAMEMRSELEEMDYNVSTFYDENEALSAISRNPEGFHVAIVEVNIGNSDGIFNFLENAKELPTIMISDIHCLSTMMKCIALGAVEFLQKPLSDDKLRNIWQHVVHKAFNAGGKDVLESLKPVKESAVSMLQLQSENCEPDYQESKQADYLSLQEEKEEDLLLCIDKYPAPSTPQLKQGERSLDNGNCHDQTNSTEHESGEQDGECKSVEITCGNSISETNALTCPSPQKFINKQEHEPSYGCRSDINTSPCSENKDPTDNSTTNATDRGRVPATHDSCGSKANRKKTKVDWTSELHKKFVQAVEQLGVDQAIPSRILELMKVEGLTRHNVASHLQKYRMHRRHILPKEEERRWPRPGDPVPRSYYAQKPVMAFPPYHPSHGIPAGRIYPGWVAPNSYPNGMQMWGLPYHPGWHIPTESWLWKPYSGMHAEAWGCPVMPPPHGSYQQFPLNKTDFHSSREHHEKGNVLLNSCDMHPAEEVIDKVVKEAISKPWLPLPLGLKPPSTECVLNELTRQGISKIPHHMINGSHIG